MALGRGKNRRRADLAGRTAAVRSLASRVATAMGRIAATGAVCAALYFGGRFVHQWATTSDTFALSTLTVTGTRRASELELVRLGGLARGQNLFTLDVAGTERAIAQHPWVRSVKVTRHFPAAVAIEVTEHEPAALVSLGELYLLDREGQPFKKLTAGDRVALPLVTGITREQYVEDPEAAAARFARALATLRQYEEAQKSKADRVSEVRILGDALTIVTSTGAEVRLGEEITPEKLARLARVRAELARRGLSAEVIHLDNRVRPGWVAVKVSTPPPERGRVSKQ